MSWSDTLTEEEKEGVEELKRRTMKDCTPKMLEDDALFYRFMKARDFNLKNAEDMLRKSIEWRKEYQVDTIITDYKPPEVIEKYAPITILGYDKDGDMIKYYDLGRSDPKGLVKSAKKIDVYKFNIQILEKDLEIMKQRSKERIKYYNQNLVIAIPGYNDPPVITNLPNGPNRTPVLLMYFQMLITNFKSKEFEYSEPKFSLFKIGVPIRKLCYIINFDEITFAKATCKQGLDILISSAKMYQDNYPELIKYMFFINGSFYLTLLYSVLRPFLAPVLQDKIKVYGTDEYQEALLKLIDADVLPAFIGGTRTDPDGDPNCRTFIKWAREIDEKYYMRKSERRLSTSPGVRKLTVTRFAKSDIRFEVSEPGSLLEWEFETKSRDIGFGVYFKDPASGEAKPAELVPKQRIDTSMEPETGMYRCKNIGTYIFVFDNSYSWLHPKDIFYRVKITGPDGYENSPWT